MTTFDFAQANWFALLDENGKRLVRLSELLYEREERMQTVFESYSFVVFPMAKAYEGFIKLYLKKTGILHRDDYIDAKFRIGRALNPDISDRHKDEWWLYGDLERLCGKDTSRSLWDAWIECRNHVFHFYFDQEIGMTLEEAKKKLLQMNIAMAKAMQCLTLSSK
ncbi:MAG: hypothetical protein ABI758_03215 [Candidatus Woesebacteria bacterium]